jgi:hypothetical protein
MPSTLVTAEKPAKIAFLPSSHYHFFSKSTPKPVRPGLSYLPTRSVATQKYDSSKKNVGRPRKRKDNRKLVIAMALENLSKIMGHASITTTEIYSHLHHDLFAEKAFDAVRVDLSKPAGDVVSISRSSGTDWADFGHTRCSKRRTKPS